MRPTVRIAFDLSLAGQGDFFTLDDPVKGELDGTSFRLGGDILTDVSDSVRSVSIRRGRSSETSNVDAGAGQIVLDNRNRFFDPLASASVSPYAPSLLPRKEITVDLGGTRQYTGVVEDWDLQYERGGDSVTVAKLTDGMTLLNEDVLASGAGATGLSGSVIYSTASTVGWPLGRTNLDEGTATVGAHTLERDTNALQYMQKIANTEQALLFVGKNGSLRFRDRISPRRTMGTVFADDGSGIPFQGIEIVYGTEFLFTEINITYPSGSVEVTDTFTAAASAVANYGTRALGLDTFLSGSAAASGIGDLLAQRYGEPTLRIVGLTLEVDSLTSSQQEEVLRLELGDGVTVQFTPNGIGEPISRELAVDSISHNISPGFHDMKLRLFEPVLLRFEGSVTGTSATDGSVVGVIGLFGFVVGDSSNVGSITGAKGAEGSAAGSTAAPTGTVTGTKSTSFVLDTSELDGTDTLGT